jgi:hypothetical protein
MSSTFTTPIRIFKRNNPSNDGTISPDNTGAASVTQQVQFSGVAAAGAITTYGIGSQSTTADNVVIPAGSLISNIRLFETTAPSALTAGVITAAIGATTIGTITATATNGGVISLVPATTTAAAALLANVGTSDVTITFTWARSTITGTLAGVLDVSYVARNLDGSIVAYGSGYTNN